MMIKVPRINKARITVSPEDIIFTCDEYVIVSDLSKVECHINYEEAPVDAALFNNADSKT